MPVRIAGTHDGWELYDSFDRIPPGRWDQARSATPSTFTDPDFLQAVEASPPEGSRIWHMILTDSSGQPEAAASLCLLPVDLFLLASPRLQRAAQLPRRVVPGLGRLKILLCGLPVSVGQSQIGYAPGVDRRAVIKRIAGLLHGMGRRLKAAALVFKEFTPADDATLEPLAALGYVKAESPPMYELNRRFDSFDSYKGALKSHYRADIRRSEKKFEKAGCRVEHLTNPSRIVELYTPALHALYEAVVAKSEVKLELLPVEFFHELTRRLPGKVSLTVVWQGNAVVAFNWGLMDSVFHFVFCGIDYRRNAEADLYFNLMYHQFDYAFRAGAEAVELGQTADAFKTRLGCSGVPRSFFVKPMKPIIGLVVRNLADVLFPPRPVLAGHDVFKAVGRS